MIKAKYNKYFDLFMLLPIQIGLLKLTHSYTKLNTMLTYLGDICVSITDLYTYP